MTVWVVRVANGNICCGLEYLGAFSTKDLAWEFIEKRVSTRSQLAPDIRDYWTDEVTVDEP